MGNYRSKMRSLGHTDVMVNAGKRGRYSTSSDPPNKNIKKPRKGEDAVNYKPPVSQILQRWPALFRESQVYQEFSRVVGKNLKQEFYGSLDCNCPQLIQIFRSKRGLTGQILSDLLQQAKTSDIADMRCVAMRGLPVLLGDDQTVLQSMLSSDDGDSYQHVPVHAKCMGNTFLFIQQVLLGLGKKELKGKILAVTNQLTM
ncbi:uncharacterized protein LOC113645414 isoform X1 [Tachysurus ichikawai]